METLPVMFEKTTENASEREIGWKAKDFNLISIDNQKYSLNQLRGIEGTVVVFICNHCPYVISIANRLSYESKELKKFMLFSNKVKRALLSFSHFLISS